MSRIILNQIALQKIKVISETKKYFLLQPSSAAAPSTSNYGITPPTYTQTGYSGWSDTEPSYTVGDERVLYELTETIYSDNTWDYSTPTVSSSYEAAKEAYNEAIQAEEDIQDFVDLGLKQGYIWDNPTSKSASGTVPAYPAGSYIASGTLSGGTRSINRSNSNTYGLNTWISTGGINLRYNAIDLMKLTTSNLFFYYPSTSTQQKKAISLGTNGTVNSLAFYGFNNDNKTMELTNNALTFYNPSNGTDKLASLSATGLILSKGGVKAGSPNQSGFIYLSTEPYGSYSINGSSGISDWKEIIGTKFGVRADGTLYANNAIINGSITLGTGSKIGTTDASTVVTNASTGAGAASDLATYKETVSDTYATKDALSEVEGQIPDISGLASKSAAVAEEQLIYIQATSGTNSVSAYPSSSTTTSSYWVTQTGESIPNGTPPDSATGQTPRWTTKRPSYQKNYPVIFVAKQKKMVSGAITCTTPIKDDTMTIIDGGHITTGTIDTNRLNANTIKSNIVQTTELNADKITSGKLQAEYIQTSGINIAMSQVNNLNDTLDTKIDNENFSDTVEGISTDINSLNGLVSSSTASLAENLGNATEQLTSLRETYENDYSKLSSFILTGEEVDGNVHTPYILLGTRNDGDFIARITNEKFQLGINNSSGSDLVFSEIAYLSPSEVKVTNQLSFGNFAFYQRTNGHFSLKFTGGVD